MESDPDTKYPFEKQTIDVNITNKITAVTCDGSQLILGTEDGYLLSYEILKDSDMTTTILDVNVEKQK